MSSRIPLSRIHCPGQRPISSTWRPTRTGSATGSGFTSTDSAKRSWTTSASERNTIPIWARRIWVWSENRDDRSVRAKDGIQHQAHYRASALWPYPGRQTKRQMGYQQGLSPTVEGPQEDVSNPESLSVKFPIPEAVFNQHIILLGKTRSGKSSVMRLCAEHLLEKGKPVTIVDPKGDWWGLKLSKDGKRPGYPMVIFGGDHADIPINPQSGNVVAELLSTGNRSSIIDLGGWTVADRTRFWIA